MQAFFITILSFLLKTVVIKFIALSSIFALVVWLVPFSINFILEFIDVSVINNYLSNLPTGVLWILYYFRLDFGLPLVISAVVTRFLIRRLPIIG